MKGLAILGSTGTIGANTLAVVDQFPEKFRVVSLAAGRNVDVLREQVRRYRPEVVSVLDAEDARGLATEFPGTRFLWGQDGNAACIESSDVDIVVMGIVGFAALRPTLVAVRARKTVALANKESLVVGGSLLRAEIARSGATVIPVDSEHNALYQLLLDRPREDVATIVLTASGGPLLRRPELPLDDVTPAIAVAHPNWKMGPKISVDSATLMNKGLELIEAHFLFDYPQDRIEVWVHPQSIVHGAVWLTDNSCLAQLTKPDMRSSIGFALGYPERLGSVIPKLKMSELAKLEFFEPDTKRFPALSLARQALDAGPSHLVALNAANEVAVQAFLDGALLFTHIPSVISQTLDRHVPVALADLETIFSENTKARELAAQVVSRFAR